MFCVSALIDKTISYHCLCSIQIVDYLRYKLKFIITSCPIIFKYSSSLSLFMISLTLNHLIRLKHRPARLNILHKNISSNTDISVLTTVLIFSKFCGFKCSVFLFLHVQRNIAASLWRFASNIRLVLTVASYNAICNGDILRLQLRQVNTKYKSCSVVNNLHMYVQYIPVLLKLWLQSSIYAVTGK